MESGIYIFNSICINEYTLIDEPKTYLRNIYAHGDSKGNLDIIYERIGDEKATISHKLLKDNKVIKEGDTDKFKVENVDLWDIDNPNLYTLETTIEVNGDKEVYQTRFGFRDVLFTNHGFYLNGKKIKLVGLNRHQGYPIMGYAASKSLQIDDADILKKEVGVNVVRTSHYPQSEHFLNRCDEIGLLVLNEIPGWQHLSHSETWRSNCVNNARRMVLKERNHPSLIAHGVRVDESVDDHELYTKTNEVAHTLDPFRQTIGVRNFKDSELLEDIYGYNDFSCDSMKIGLIDPKNVKHMNKPYLVTEYLGHMDPVKPTSDEQKRIEISLRHAKVIDDNYKHEDACGAIGWCFVDWNMELNKQASAQGIYLYALKAAMELADMCSDDERKEELTLEYERAVAAARQYFFDMETGVFVSGSVKQISWASQCWMILGGAVSVEEGNAIMDRMKGISDVINMVTPYMYHHYISALIILGRDEEAKETIKDYWGGMEAEGADTFWELYRPGFPDESPYGGTIVNSYCHAWSCAPAYFIRKYGW